MQPAVDTVDVSVIIPSLNRSAILKKTLERICECDPRPREILVHVDGGDKNTAEMLRSEFHTVRVLNSENVTGPGGGRNLLVDAAANEWIVSFDDDSWAYDYDFFQKVIDVTTGTDASLLACQIIERDQTPTKATADRTPTSTFVGCGCVFRKSEFLATDGYVPLPLAYGMEENDLALGLIRNSGQIVYAPELRVQHDCDRETHQSTPEINAAHIANTALLVFLRYPIRYWPLGGLQVINRLCFSLGKGRWRGTMKGLLSIPGHCWRYRAYRKPVATQTIDKFRKLSRRE